MKKTIIFILMLSLLLMSVANVSAFTTLDYSKSKKTGAIYKRFYGFDPQTTNHHRQKPYSYDMITTRHRIKSDKIQRDIYNRHKKRYPIYDRNTYSRWYFPRYDRENIVLPQKHKPTKDLYLVKHYYRRYS